jgi:hypothetical protein
VLVQRFGYAAVWFGGEELWGFPPQAFWLSTKEAIQLQQFLEERQHQERSA